MHTKIYILNLWTIWICTLLLGCYDSVKGADDSVDNASEYSNSVDCANVVSTEGIEACIGEKITAKGSVECEGDCGGGKANSVSLRFPDGTQLLFSPENPNFEEYNGRSVIVIGKLYQCDDDGMSQCVGLSIVDVESIRLNE